MSGICRSDVYLEDRDCTIDFMTSNGKAQHSAPLRMNAPATAVDEIEKAYFAVEGGEGEGVDRGWAACIDETVNKNVVKVAVNKNVSAARPTDTFG